MRKNGFTLIELLAVIVILAIIALIATPIILGIINDAREKANERSVELYASAVKNGIAAYQLVEGKEVEAKTYTKETLPFEVEYDGNVECTSIIISEDSKVSLTGCKVNGGEKTYNYGIEETPSLAGTMAICDPASDQWDETKQPLEAGYKYNCKVDPNKPEYTFYVLSYNDENGNITTNKTVAKSVNLIMDSNITSTGLAIKDANPTDTGLVPWYADAKDNSYGPITAMNHLQTATSGWANTNELTINKFTECDYEGNCTDKTMTEYVVNARMPYLSEVSDFDWEEGSNAYLYDYLHADCFDDEWNGYVSCDVATNFEGPHKEGMTHVIGVNGYWTLSSSDVYHNAWDVSDGGISGHYVTQEDRHGVRPVINLSI